MFVDMAHREALQRDLVPKGFGLKECEVQAFWSRLQRL